jgi:transcriptional regulator with XRE-family HTH domain
VRIEDMLAGFGTEIAARRRAAKLTQEKAAEKVGTTSAWLSQIERGVGAPSFDLVFKLASLFEVPPETLIASGRRRVDLSRTMQELLAVAERLPEGAQRTLVSAAEALDREWPRETGPSPPVPPPKTS